MFSKILSFEVADRGLSIHTAGIGPGDEVITALLTFCATVNAILHAGATPIPLRRT